MHIGPGSDSISLSLHLFLCLSSPPCLSLALIQDSISISNSVKRRQTKYDAEWLTVLNCFPNLSGGIKENKWSIVGVYGFVVCVRVVLSVLVCALHSISSYEKWHWTIEKR